MNHFIGFAQLLANTPGQIDDARIGSLELYQLSSCIRDVQGIAQIVRQAGNKIDVPFLVGLAETADGLACGFFNRMADNVGVAFIERQSSGFRNREQDFAKYLQLMDQVMRPVVGHVGPLAAMRRGEVGAGCAVGAGVVWRQCFGNIVVQGGQHIDEQGFAEPGRAWYFSSDPRPPLRDHLVATFHKRCRQFGQGSVFSHFAGIARLLRLVTGHVDTVLYLQATQGLPRRKYGRRDAQLNA